MTRLVNSFSLIVCTSILICTSGCSGSKEAERGVDGEAASSAYAGLEEVLHYLHPRNDIPVSQTDYNDTVLIERRSYGDYLFESIGVYEHARFTISNDGQVVFATEKDSKYGHYFRVGYRTHAGSFESRGDELAPRVIPMGADITGDGVPNLVVTGMPMGNSGTWSIDIFEIGEEFRHIGSIAEIYGDLFDLNGDGRLEYIGADTGYWNLPVFPGIPMALIPYPRFIMSYQDGEYKPDAELMRKDAPDREERQRIAAEIREIWPEEGAQRADSEPGAPIEFVRKIIQLVYGGNLETVRYLEDHAVPDHAKQGLVDTILPKTYEIISSSRHAEHLLQMNGVETFWPR